MPRFVAAIFAAAVAAAGVWSAEARACTVTGTKVGFGAGADFDQEVVVRPRGADPIRLTGVSAERLVATIPSSPGARTRLEVHDVISFSGTTGPIPYQVSRSLETAQGMVKLYPGATVSRTAAAGGAVVGSVEMRGAAETLEAVSVPCDALAVKVQVVSPHVAPISGDGTWWTPKGRGRTIALRAGPGDHGRPVVLKVRDRGASAVLGLQRLATTKDWTKVAREGFQAVAIGWVPTAALEQLAARPAETGCCYGETTGAGYSGRGRSGKAASFDGPAHLTVGTTIFAQPGAQEWATVEKDGLFQVRYDEGAQWAEITSIPGVRGPNLHAYVPIAAIKRAP